MNTSTHQNSAQKLVPHTQGTSLEDLGASIEFNSVGATANQNHHSRGSGTKTAGAFYKTNSSTVETILPNLRKGGKK